MLHVLGVEPREPEAGIFGPPGRFKAGESLDLGADVDHRCVLVEAPQVRNRGNLLDQCAPAVLGRTPSLLGSLALRYVAQISREEQALPQYRADRDLYRELAAVAAQGGHLQAPAQDARLAGAGAGQGPPVSRAVRRRDDERCELLTHRLGARPSERGLGGVVPLDDEPVGVDHDH
jgi:hypothetical protein